MVQKHEEVIPMTPLKDIYVGPPVVEAVPEQNLAQIAEQPTFQPAVKEEEIKNKEITQGVIHSLTIND